MSAGHQQSSRQLQERLTSLAIADVLSAAIDFFSRRGGVYTAFLEKRGPAHVVLRGQGGEELVIAARETEAGIAVTGSSYLFDQQVARFLQSLPPAPTPRDAVTLPAGEAVDAAAALSAGASA